MDPRGMETGAMAGTPTLSHGPPVAGIAVRLEASAPLQKWEKPGHPSLYFYAQGVSLAGDYIAFPKARPGPDYIRVLVTGVVADMGVHPDTAVFIRKDDPFRHLAQEAA
jgi:hypothetical protein